MIRSPGSVPSLAIFFYFPLVVHRCGPCRAIKPVYEELSKEYEGIGFGKVDIDDNQDAAAAFQISSVPTFIFFNGQKPFKAFAGADKAQLESVVKELDDA